jgi:hypothetical protein
MKKAIFPLLIVSILLNIILVYLFVIKGQTIKTSDNRTAIIMSESNKDFVLQEMRDFLESVQKINEGILKNDTKLIIEAGKISGGSVISHAPKGLMKTLLSGFKKLGFSTHALFDEIANNAKNDFNKDLTQKKLNSLLKNCTACHQSFKIATKE